MPATTRISFIEFWEAVLIHSCPACKDYEQMKKIKQPRITVAPIACVECYTDYVVCKCKAWEK